MKTKLQHHLGHIVRTTRLASHIALLCLTSTALFADVEVSLDLTADGDSRWYEFFSGAFCQVDQGFDNDPNIDGPFLIKNDPSITIPADESQPISRNSNTPVYDQIAASTGINCFPNEVNWANIGTLTVDESSLVNGTGSAVILSFSADFDQYIADNDAITSGGYTTTIDSVAGSVLFEDGSIIGFDVRCNLTFTYDAGNFGNLIGVDSFDYTGTLTIGNGIDQHGTNFDLYVDSAISLEPIFETSSRYVWDATGSASSTTTVTVATPITPINISTSFDDGDFVLSFPTFTGNDYQVKWTSDLVTGGVISTWNDLGPQITGDGSDKQVTDPDSSQQTKRFYSVIISN